MSVPSSTPHPLLRPAIVSAPLLDPGGGGGGGTGIESSATATINKPFLPNLQHGNRYHYLDFSFENKLAVYRYEYALLMSYRDLIYYKLFWKYFVDIRLEVRLG